MKHFKYVLSTAHSAWQTAHYIIW